MTPDEAIAKLKMLPEDQQRMVLGQLDAGTRAGILSKLQSPASQLDLSNRQGQGTYQMTDRSGQTVAVPYGQVQQAGNLGYSFASSQDRFRYAKDNAADPNRTGGASYGAGGHSGLNPEQDQAKAQQIEQNASMPMQIIGGIAKGAGTLGRPVLDAAALVTHASPDQVSAMLAPITPAQKYAKYGTMGAGIATAGPEAIARPLATIGGLAAGAVGAGAGKIAGDAAGISPESSAVLSDVLGGAAGMAGAEGAESQAAREIAGKIKPAVASVLPALVDGPPESLMTRAVKPGKNNVNWNADVQQAIPLMKSAEETIGRPIQGIDDAMDAARAAKQQIWKQYQQRLGPATQMGATIDGNQIADAMMQSIGPRMKAQNPALVERITQTADTYRRPLTLEETENFLSGPDGVNNELSSYYAKNKVGRRAAEADPEMAATVAEGDALRSALYGKLDQLSGPGASQLKQAYGALSNVEKELSGRQIVASRQNPESLSEQLSTVRGAGKIAKGMLTMNPGDVLEGTQNIAVSRALKARNSSDAMIARAFQVAQRAQPFPEPSFPAPVPPGFQLPAQSGAPTIIPYYPEMSPGERAAALVHYLRNSSAPLALPAKVSPIPLLPPR